MIEKAIPPRYRLSIAMATFNGAKFLDEQLASFASQTRLPDELVVCDDGSTDETMSIVEKFARHATFEVRIERNRQTLGYTKNFEKALSLCTGDLIFFSDQDDVWFTTKMQYVERQFQQTPGTFVLIHDGRLVDEKLVWFGSTKRNQVMAGWGSDESLVQGALTIVHKDFVPNILPIPEGVNGHDIWIHLLAQFLNVRTVLDMPLQLIRRHSSNSSTWVASAVTKINKVSVLLSHFRSSTAQSYENRLVRNQSLRVRLNEILRDNAGKFSKDIVYASLEYLESERVGIIHRSEITSAPFFRRKLCALRVLLRGEYRYFNGFWSFLRDFAR